jgi:hypothetical protein
VRIIRTRKRQNFNKRQLQNLKINTHLKSHLLMSDAGKSIAGVTNHKHSYTKNKFLARVSKKQNTDMARPASS